MTDQAEIAAALTGAGINVVLCQRPGLEHPPSSGPGRLARFVSDAGAAGVVGEEALAMARELFGGAPVVVRTTAEAEELIGGLPDLPVRRSGTVDSHP